MLSLAHRANGTVNITGVLGHQGDSPKAKVVVVIVVVLVTAMTVVVMKLQDGEKHNILQGFVIRRRNNVVVSDALLGKVSIWQGSFGGYHAQVSGHQSVSSCHASLGCEAVR